jgi:hypothetical protein
MSSLSSLFSARRSTGLLAAALALGLLAGCDSGGGLDDTPTVSPEETAAAISQSLAESTGGTVDEFADGAALAGGAATEKARSRTFRRSRSCTYDDGDEVWTCTVEVSGGRGRIETAEFDRTYRAQFFAGEQVVRRPAEADSMTFEVVEGEGAFRTPRIDWSHTLHPASWAFAETAPDTYAVYLRSDEAGRTVNSEVSDLQGTRTRTRNATVRKTRTEGLVFRAGDGLVDGTIEGAYEAEVEIERADGSTVDRSVSVTYAAAFSADGAEITFTGGGERFTGESFAFDPTTGEIE